MLLMEEAARIAQEEHGSNKIAVISGSYTPLFAHEITGLGSLVVFFHYHVKNKVV